MIQLDTDIPAPPLRRRKNKRYPWDGMQVGDSFLVDTPRNTMANAAAYHEKLRGWTIQLEPEGEKLRVWRMA